MTGARSRPSRSADADLELLRDIAASPPETAEALLFGHPRLLSAMVLASLAETVGGLPEGGDRSRLERPLETARDRVRQLEAGHRFPVGLGPLERLWQRQANGEISAAEAERLARDDTVTAELSPLYVRDLSSFLLSNVMQGDDWRPNLELGNLLLAAAEAMPDSPDRSVVWRTVVSHWMDLARDSLVELADGRLYLRALALGERCAAEARAAGDTEFLRRMLFHLGTLHLDPYTGVRSMAHYEDQDRVWRERVQYELADELGVIPEEEWRMPEALEALRLASDYLREAAELASGDTRGRTLKALIQALEWRDGLGDPVSSDDVVQACHEALESLDQAQSPVQWLAVYRTLERRGHPLDPGELAWILRTPVEEWAARLGAASAIELVFHLVELLDDADPPTALGLIRQLTPILRRHGDEEMRRMVWTSEVRLIGRAMAPEAVPDPEQPDLASAAEALIRRAHQAEWHPTKLAAGLVALATNAPRGDQEEAGLELLRAVEQLAPGLVTEHEEALRLLTAYLTVGMAVNAVNAQQWSAAVELYALALQRFLPIDLPTVTLDCLRKIEDLQQRRGAEVATDVLGALMVTAPEVESRFGDKATWLVQRMSRQVSAAVGGQRVPSELPFLLFQVAKGLRFRAALESEQRQTWEEDERGTELLIQIATAEAAIPGGSAAPAAGSAIEPETLLTAYASPIEQTAGASPETRLTNLKHRYDMHLTGRLYAARAGTERLYLSAADVQAALDERTVLLDFYLGATDDGRMAVHVLLLTREEVLATVIAHPTPSIQVYMEDQGRRLHSSPFGLLVEATREGILEEPEGDVVSPNGSELLQDMLRGFLGPFPEELQRLHASGKRHLCIVPNGPLHFFPMHLLDEGGRPLANRWIVSYLPTVHLLAPRVRPGARPSPRARPLTVIGLTFEGNNMGLAELPQVREETGDIAAAYGITPILDRSATKPTVLEALETSRFVHLSTHGVHNVEAPAFQFLYTASAADGFDRLHAFELLQHDLRGVELLTMSACETALGRFDLGDNPRGLPASFLLAGVSTLIGTLWPVEVETSRLFFTALYEKLAAGASRLDGFAWAQQQARRARPEFRDWGAFYLAGNWT
jgi:CHAT domain-containing protein